jgi:lipopolysaccharide export LptBFGC system permease protein LptF
MLFAFVSTIDVVLIVFALLIAVGIVSFLVGLGIIIILEKKAVILRLKKEGLEKTVQAKVFRRLKVWREIARRREKTLKALAKESHKKVKPNKA